MDLFAIDITLPRRAFDLRVELSLAAETVALVGPSGSGKTSLLKTIAGLERPTAGRIVLADEVWLDAVRGLHVSPERRRVGYLPQDYGLFPHLSVAANVRFASRQDRPDLLERLRIAHLASARPPELSGGERQRAALARALAREPKALLLDEPFAALDAITRRSVRQELADILSDLRLPTLLVTHAFEDATVLGDRVGVLDQGQVVQLGSAAELQRHPVAVVVAALTGANILHGVAAGSTVTLDGGGTLDSASPVQGRVTVAVHPWAFELVDPAKAQLTDRVLGIREDRGSTVVRLTRLTVAIPAGANGGPPRENEVVGLRASPGDVTVIQAPGEDQPGSSELYGSSSPRTSR